MQIYQNSFSLKARPRGFHLITEEVLRNIALTVDTGVLHLFLKHTSASLTLNENADPTVRSDLEMFFNDLSDNKPYYRHTLEGEDDMPAHVKSSLLGVSLTIPVTAKRLNLGTWQGIYLCEHRNYGGSRTLVATVTGV